jgi:F0F1-type ATP synthase assembly protein I
MSLKGQRGPLRQLAMAMELPFVMVGEVVIGGGIGYLLDRWWHTSPVITLVGGVLGFAGGIWDIIRRLSREEKNQ